MSASVCAPQLGGKTAFVLFIFVLLAFVVESQLTQYAQSNLGFRQPYFIFYTVHSSLSLIFFLHITYLLLSTTHSFRDYWNGLIIAIKNHLSPQETFNSDLPFPFFKFIRLVLLVLFGTSTPALLWFCAVSLSPLADVNALWNTNAFFAYVFAVKLFKLQWEKKRLFAVVLATSGVMAVIYGGSSVKPLIEKKESSPSSGYKKFSSPLIGDSLTLIASIAYGLYQVLYKRHVTLPSYPEHAEVPGYNQLPTSEDDHLPQSSPHDPEPIPSPVTSIVYPPPLGLHANLLTSFAGLTTLAIFWLLFPILHYTGVELFRLPPDAKTALVLAGIASSGVFYNAGFMILLGIWGPIVASLGSLLTIVLVFISDVVVGDGIKTVTAWSAGGVGIIVIAFGVLVHVVVQSE